MESPEVVRASSIGSMLHNIARPYITGRVLDVGCGAKPYKRLFPDCEWVGLDARPVGEIQAMAEEMPCEDGEYDTVVCTDLLSYVPEPGRVVMECARVVKPGGYVVIAAANTLPEDNEHLWGIGMRGLDFLLSAAELEGVHGIAEGALIGAEWSTLGNYEKYALPIPSDVTGWIDQMNRRYPAISFMVARKPDAT